VRIAVVLTVIIVAASAGLAAGPVRSEARIVFDGPEVLKAGLGPLLGELDVCTAGENGDGSRYLVVIAGADELDAIRRAGFEVEVTWPDIGDKFRAMTGCDPDDGSFRDFGYFFDYWELQDTLRRLAALYPSITQLDSSMLSFQNRPLWCLKVSDNPGVEEDEPQVFFNGATHAREPLGTHTCVAFASLLLSGYGTDSLITWLVNNREIYFVPVTNPDGYVYNSDSGGAGSYWRKNRRGPVPPNIGIDLNRNYGYKWGYDNSGSSPTPSAETYRGPNRFSEPEVEAIHQFERSHKFRAQIDFHTYGRYNMYPWAYAGDAPPEEALLQEIVDTFALNNGYPYTGQWYYTLYPSNGTSIDWEFADTLDAGVPKFISYAFSCELGINDFWYGSSDPAYVESEIALNIPNCYYLTRLSGVWLEPVSLTVNDSTGNNNGQLDPGERAFLRFTIQNRALHTLDTAQAVTAVLVPAESVIRVLTPSAVFPDMPRRSSGGPSQFQVRCDSGVQPYDTIDLRLNVTFNDAGVTITQPVMFRIVVGSNPVAVEGPGLQAASHKLAPTVVRGVLLLPQSVSSSPSASCLLDIAGQNVLDLHAGPNDVSGLAPGVYFVRAISGKPSAVGCRKVLLAR
jgi:hypothetical protein